jgi:hypothetical protein
MGGDKPVAPPDATEKLQALVRVHILVAGLVLEAGEMRGTAPRVSTLRKLAKGLDVDPRELLDD